MTEDEVIDRYSCLLQAQLDGRREKWPDRFVFPKPASEIERRAFDAFMLKVRSQGGRPVVPIYFEGGPEAAE